MIHVNKHVKSIAHAKKITVEILVQLFVTIVGI